MEAYRHCKSATHCEFVLEEMVRCFMFVRQRTRRFDIVRAPRKYQSPGRACSRMLEPASRWRVERQGSAYCAADQHVVQAGYASILSLYFDLITHRASSASMPQDSSIPR
jgi:hypothetical protein